MQPSTFFLASYTKTLLFAGIAAACVCTTPHRLIAQDTTVYDPDSVTTLPKLVKQRDASFILRRAYPEQLYQAGIEGNALIAIIVAANGKVEPGSSSVIMTTVPEFGTAGRTAVEQFEFKPALLHKKPVRSRFIVPVVFKIH